MLWCLVVGQAIGACSGVSLLVRSSEHVLVSVSLLVRPLGHALVNVSCVSLLVGACGDNFFIGHPFSAHLSK